MKEDRDKRMRITVTGTGEKSIKTLLEERGVSLYAPCSGRGTCGRCAVIVETDNCPPSDRDIERFSKDELGQGFRLACRAFPKGDVTVRVPEEENPVICTDYSDKSALPHTSRNPQISERDFGILIGIDLGTTTIVLTSNERAGTPVKTRAFLNPLSRYGSDVVSRLEAAENGKLFEMQSLLRGRIEEELRHMIDSSVSASDHPGHSGSNHCPGDVRIALAGNTTMTHIFIGWDTSGLGTFPFKPYSLSPAETSLCGFPVFVFPGISAFVGGDIVAGIYGLDLINGNVGDMLMDLGTNGEIVLKTEKGLIASSASAGPAIEGAHLSCGTGCVEGAVTGVTLENLRPVLTVAGEKAPVSKGLAGACGSAILELVDELLRTGILKPDGSFIKNYADEGFAFGTDRNGRVLALTQADVRELQLAKGAVSTAAMLLCEKGNVAPESLNISLAGGMGSGLRPERIKRTGIIPSCDSVHAVGNSSLMGLMKFLRESSGPENKNTAVKTLSDLAGSVTVYDPALEKGFQERFMASLNFLQ